MLKGRLEYIDPQNPGVFRSTTTCDACRDQALLQKHHSGSYNTCVHHREKCPGKDRVLRTDIAGIPPK